MAAFGPVKGHEGDGSSVGRPCGCVLEPLEVVGRESARVAARDVLDPDLADALEGDQGAVGRRRGPARESRREVVVGDGALAVGHFGDRALYLGLEGNRGHFAAGDVEHPYLAALREVDPAAVGRPDEARQHGPGSRDLLGHVPLHRIHDQAFLAGLEIAQPKAGSGSKNMSSVLQQSIWNPAPERQKAPVRKYLGGEGAATGSAGLLMRLTVGHGGDFAGCKLEAPQLEVAL